jgi:hypothetical protein
MMSLDQRGVAPTESSQNDSRAVTQFQQQDGHRRVLMII